MSYSFLFMIALFLAGSTGIIFSQATEGSSSGYVFYNLEVDGNEYSVRYLIMNASIQEISVNEDTKSLIVLINSGQQKGELQLELERVLIDAKGADESDVEYNVFVDGNRVDFEEPDKNERSRFLTIPFEGGSRQITITGTHVVPEFGHHFLFAIIVVTIGSVILLSRLTIFKPRA